MATGRRRGRAIIIFAFILILLLALVLVVARFYLPGGNQGPAQTSGNPAPGQPTATPVSDVVNIVVTTQDVRRGQELTDNLLASVSIPKADYTEGVFFKDKKDVSGARAKYDLKAHTPLTTALVITKGSSGSIPSFEIPAGKVAIAVPVSKLSSVAYGLQKGDHVNVIASLLLVDLDTNFQARLPNRTGVVIAPGPIGQNQTNVTALLRSPQEYQAVPSDAYAYLGRIEIDPTLNNPVYVLQSEAQRPRMVSQTLVQDAIVLQLGTFDLASQQTLSAPAPEAQAQPTTAPAPAGGAQQTTPAAATAAKLPDVITLVVEPQDAVSLNYLMLAGANLNLVMRSAGDSELKNTESVTLQFILDQYRITNPAKLPYGMEPRIDKFPEALPAFPEPKPLATSTPTP